MSGGVDSSVAAALMVEAGHEMVGATMKLWGGPSDTRVLLCRRRGGRPAGGRPARASSITCSTSPTSSIAAWSSPTSPGTPPAGPRTRASSATGISSSTDCWSERPSSVSTRWRPVTTPGSWPSPTGGGRLRRGMDPLKDQSYVLHMLSQGQLGRVLLPVGELTKTDVRRIAADLRLRTADQTRQSGCLLHLPGRWPPGVPRCPHRPAARPGGR